MIQNYKNSGDPSDQHGKHEVHQDGETTQQEDRNEDHHGGTFQLIPGGPGAFAQFFARLLDVQRQSRKVTLAPQNPEEDSDDYHPNCYFY
jgi:hypothetical protein